MYCALSLARESSILESFQIVFGFFHLEMTIYLESLDNAEVTKPKNQELK